MGILRKATLIGGRGATQWSQRSARLAVGLVVVALSVGMASPALAASKPKPKSTTTTTKPKPRPLPTPHRNQVAKDGDFAFTVTGVKCDVTSLGTDPISESAPAGAQWCLATMKVKNIKSGSQTFGASNQKAVDGHGNQLDADVGALIYLPNGASDAFAQVNPGISITATVPFQLPTAGKIAKFELHDSAFSGGVTVYNVG